MADNAATTDPRTGTRPTDHQDLLDDVSPASSVEMGSLAADVGERQILDAAPIDTRTSVDVSDMRIIGERPKARVKGSPAANWGTRAAVGTVQIDVRATLEKDDGALIFVHYNGRWNFSDPAAPGPVFTTPRVETGDKRYAWPNELQAFTKGGPDVRRLIAYCLDEPTWPQAPAAPLVGQRRVHA